MWKLKLEFKVFSSYFFFFLQSKWNVVIFILDHMAPLLWQPVNPQREFPLALVTLTLSPMLLSSSPLCWLASADQRITSESHKVKRARMPRCKQVQMLLQNEGWGYFFFSVCSCSSLCRTKSGHSSLNVLHLVLLWHWNSLPQQCISVHVAPPPSIGTPSIQCP